MFLLNFEWLKKIRLPLMLKNNNNKLKNWKYFDEKKYQKFNHLTTFNYSKKKSF